MIFIHSLQVCDDESFIYVNSVAFFFFKKSVLKFELQFWIDCMHLQLKWNGEEYQQRGNNHKLVREHRQQGLMISSCSSVDTLGKMVIISMISFRSPSQHQHGKSIPTY
jgi:hypothetical protein